ncbi:MAG: SpoIIE family protein phosphatase [Rhodospirillales bacterium]|nr:SpoIIE family protein phosphatase [Rhodospirillales bacterium]
MDRQPVDDPSHVAEARRRISTLAARAGLDETECGRVSLVVTELARNLLQHGGGGELLFGLDAEVDAGVEVLALDRGRGMADVARCLRDGYSTAGTPGTGLGAVQRLADEIAIHSRPGAGTVILARLRRRGGTGTSGPRHLGLVTVPRSGETVCGDSGGMVKGSDGSVALLMADGLGHGELAAVASREARRLFRAQAPRDPVAILQAVHAGLRHTRGAAVAVAVVAPNGRSVSYGGIGNIAGLLVDESGARRMVSHNGTAGHTVFKLQAFSYDVAGHPTIVMHSDGLSTSWSLDSHPGLLRQDPTLAAATLYRDHARGRDDCGVLVWKG